ncbi:MAG: hypothetical protein NT099_07040, partial [Candidatus Saganbacteria bacterium]|nr:hypothetical protein [Candidatus Saganbacteria bacterium]
MIKNKVITIIVLMIKVFSKTSVVIRLSPTIIKTTYQVFIVNLMMLFDRLSHKKTLVFYVEELGFLQFIFPIIAIL